MTEQLDASSTFNFNVERTLIRLTPKSKAVVKALKILKVANYIQLEKQSNKSTLIKTLESLCTANVFEKLARQEGSKQAYQLTLKGKAVHRAIIKEETKTLKIAKISNLVITPPSRTVSVLNEPLIKFNDCKPMVAVRAGADDYKQYKSKGLGC